MKDDDALDARLLLKVGERVICSEGKQSMGTKAEIADQLQIALQRLGADVVLLSIIGSYGDTLDDGEVLQLLQDYNSDRATLLEIRPPRRGKQ